MINPRVAVPLVGVADSNMVISVDTDTAECMDAIMDDPSRAMACHFVRPSRCFSVQICHTLSRSEQILPMYQLWILCSGLMILHTKIDIVTPGAFFLWNNDLIDNSSEWDWYSHQVLLLFTNEFAEMCQNQHQSRLSWKNYLCCHSSDIHQAGIVLQ